ncbi:MAG: HAD-IB family phosphatase, partial [Flavisolibacter sp.]
MKKTIVISDFDGTITTRDALVEMLDSYAGPRWREIARLVKSGSMGTKVGLKKEMALLSISKKEFVAFLKRYIAIDRGFKGFLSFCRKKNIKLIVV